MSEPSIEKDASHRVAAARSSARPPHLGELLCERGLITPAQLEAALKQQKESASSRQLGRILVDMGFVKSDQVAQTLAERVGIPYVVLTPDMVQRGASDRLDRDFLDRHNLLPLAFEEGWLTIAVEQFTDLFLIEDIRRVAGCMLQVVAAEPANIKETREAVQAIKPGSPADAASDAGQELDNLLGSIGVDDLKVVEHEEKNDEADLAATAADSPVVKLVSYIIQEAVRCRASDVHIEPEQGRFRIRYRVDGDLLETIRPPGRFLAPVVSRIKIMAGMDISERRLPQDGAMTLTLVDRHIDLRVSTMAAKFGEKIVMRLIDRDAAARTLDVLGFEAAMLAQFRAVIHEPNGVVLVTGPTGSGKSTTLYAALSELVSDKHNVSTIEDPVERHLAGSNQFQVHPQSGFTFAGALRSLLRQDPDIIMVGEIRDAETAKLATEAALTGHLVLSSLHTNDAPTAIPRLINMGVEPYLVAASLRGVLSQRLVRQICRHCRKSAALTPSDRDMLARLCGGECPFQALHRGAGCARCGDRGFQGRLGIFELLLLEEDVLSGIVRETGMRSLREIVRGQGMGMLLNDGLTKLGRGLITLDGLMDAVSRTAHLRHEAPAPQAAAA